MPVDFRIFPRRGLVYVRYDGAATVQESFAAFGAYMQHPDCRPGQMQLVDLAGVTEMQDDFPNLLKLQAQKADVFMGGEGETMIVYHAPCALTLRMARYIERSWENVPGIVPVVVQDEQAALQVLGQREDSFADLMAQVA